MFVFKKKDFGDKYNRYKQSTTVNVRTEYGRNKLLYYHYTTKRR